MHQRAQSHPRCVKAGISNTFCTGQSIEKTTVFSVRCVERVSLNRTHRGSGEVLRVFDGVGYLYVQSSTPGSGDYYTKKMDEVMEQMKRTYPHVVSNPCDPANEQSRSWVRCLDDTVLWASSLTSCLTQTFLFIHECAAEGVVFNEKKN